MRPDEHKKKKNAAYKKKHKIHVDKKSGSDSQERDSGRSGYLSDNCLQSDSMSQVKNKPSACPHGSRVGKASTGRIARQLISDQCSGVDLS